MRNLSLNLIKSKIFTKKFFVCVVFFWIFYIEYVSYWTLPFTWLEPPACPSSQCQKILLVSDPQLIGPEWKVNLINLITIWDSDRYLKRTFLSVCEFVQPDIIIFLGDLIDQGNTATDQEFDEYVKRFNGIYKLPEYLKNTTVIITPGDNDIGGVEDELIQSHMKRFDKAFNQTDESIITKFIEFCKVNIMKVTLQNPRVRDKDMIRVVLTHVPLFKSNNVFVNEVVKVIKPHVVFSGHLHTSYHYAAFETDVMLHRHMEIGPTNKKFKLYKFHEGSMHEFIIPTCSYRMGTRNMGYGIAFIDAEKKNMQFNVLWLPRRFVQLFLHLILLSSVGLILFVRNCKRTRRYQYLPLVLIPEKLY